MPWHPMDWNRSNGFRDGPLLAVSAAERSALAGGALQFTTHCRRWTIHFIFLPPSSIELRCAAARPPAAKSPDAWCHRARVSSTQPNSPSRIALHTRIGQCRADEGAKLFQRLALVGSAAYGGVRAETLHVGAQPTTYTTSWDSNPPSPSPPNRMTANNQRRSLCYGVDGGRWGHAGV